MKGVHDVFDRINSRTAIAKYNYAYCGRETVLTKALRRWVVSRLLALRRNSECTAFALQRDLAKKMTFVSLYRLAERGLLKIPFIGVAVLVAMITSGLLTIGIMLNNPLGTAFINFPGSFYQVSAHTHTPHALREVLRPPPSPLQLEARKIFLSRLSSCETAGRYEITVSLTLENHQHQPCRSISLQKPRFSAMFDDFL